MRLATLRDGSRDGKLVVVDPSATRIAVAAQIAPTMQAALDDWQRAEPLLRELSASVANGRADTRPLDVNELDAPLPRAYEWIDGSAFIQHVVLVRKARNAAPPETLATDPLIYQGGSGVLLGPRDRVVLHDEAWGLDFESEVVVILGDVPCGATAQDAERAIRLLTLCNDITLRNLIPNELAKGFGFFQSKPATAFAPFAVTPDEVGASYRDGRVHLPLETTLNGTCVGKPNAGAMHFSFPDLIRHITKTRSYTAGTLLGSGTVSNEDETTGYSCIAERRARDTIAFGEPKTRFLKVGDRVRIEMHDSTGRNVFGTIEQEVVAP
jgi:fumarylacetoacetate (FAA) hydrolase